MFARGDCFSGTFEMKRRRVSMVTCYELFLVLLILLAIALAWYWWRQPPFFAPLPSPICQRDSQETSVSKRDRVGGMALGRTH